MLHRYDYIPLDVAQIISSGRWVRVVEIDRLLWSTQRSLINQNDELYCLDSFRSNCWSDR